MQDFSNLGYLHAVFQDSTWDFFGQDCVDEDPTFQDSLNLDCDLTCSLSGFYGLVDWDMAYD